MTKEDAQQTLEKWSRLAKQASRDETLKKRLMANPGAVLAEYGFKVLPGVEIRVVENTDKIAYLTLPSSGPDSDLTMEQLERVAAGTDSPSESLSFGYANIKWR